MSEPSLGWQILNWVWERKEDIARSLARVYAWFRGGKDDDYGILIIGPGGTGKTTLAKLLSGQFDWLTDSPWEYRESTDTEHSTLADDPKTQLVVPAGQHHRRANGWADVEADLAAGKYRGVIVLASFGYHNLSGSYKHHALYAGSKSGFLDGYLAACREDELNILKRLATAVRICPKKLWLLTTVTKQDLWSGNEPAVAGYYLNGPWKDAVGELAADKDPKNFRQELLFACLVIRNFVTQAVEPLEKNTEGYDQKAQVASVRRLFEVIDSLRRWEESA